MLARRLAVTPPDLGLTLAVIGAVLALIAVALVVAQLRAQRAELRRLTSELATEREKAHEAAARAERQHIEHDLSGFVGEELAVIAAHAENAVHAMRDGRPGRALQPVEAIRTTAQRTLAEVRAVQDDRLHSRLG